MEGTTVHITSISIKDLFQSVPITTIIENISDIQTGIPGDREKLFLNELIFSFLFVILKATYEKEKRQCLLLLKNGREKVRVYL